MPRLTASDSTSDYQRLVRLGLSLRLHALPHEYPPNGPEQCLRRRDRTLVAAVIIAVPVVVGEVTFVRLAQWAVQLCTSTVDEYTRVRRALYAE